MMRFIMFKNFKSVDTILIKMMKDFVIFKKNTNGELVVVDVIVQIMRYKMLRLLLLKMLMGEVLFDLSIGGGLSNQTNSNKSKKNM